MDSSDIFARVIVLGNEKGGTGKSTVGMHVIVSLLRLGYSVGTIDVDANQGTLTRYLENRLAFAQGRGIRLPMPEHQAVRPANFDSTAVMRDDERERFQSALNHMTERHDYVVVDSPGSDTYLSRLAHSHADLLITPLNDSFLDLDLLADVRGNPPKVMGPSRYSEMVWQMKKVRAERDGGTIDWVVMRSRLANLDARNKRSMTDALEQISGRMGFRLAKGFSERVIFRELFLQGLTVNDLREKGAKVSLKMSHVAARQEVRELLEELGIVEREKPKRGRRSATGANARTSKEGAPA